LRDRTTGSGWDTGGVEGGSIVYSTPGSRASFRTCTESNKEEEEEEEEEEEGTVYSGLEGVSHS
jgi:hypothetical protein